MIADQPLIRLVAQRALAFGFSDPVFVATDDRRVADAVADLDVEAVLTSRRHRNGTERTAAEVKLPRFAATFAASKKPTPANSKCIVPIR